MYRQAFQEVINHKRPAEDLIPLSKLTMPQSLLDMFKENDSLTYRTVRSNDPISSYTSAICLYEYCTDWYSMPGGSFIGETCTHGYDFCNGEGGGGSSGGTHTVGIIGSNQVGSGSYGGHGSSSNTVSSTINTGGGFIHGNGIATFHTSYSAYNNIEVSVTLNHYNVTDITSRLTGITLGSNYTQDNFVVTGVNGNIISFSISYSLSLVIFVQGIGTIYTYPNQIIEGKIDKSTGRGTILH